jgi:hypothetical protein
VPKGLTDGFTLPPTWGVLEFIGGGLIHKVKAEKLEREAPTTGFMCAMLRGRERAVTEAAAKVTKDREEHIRRTTLFGVKNAEDELKRLRAKLAEINEATGIELSDWTPTRNIIDRLQAAKSLELIARNVRFIERGAADLLEDAREIQAAAEAILPQEAEKGDKNAETL